MRKITVIANWKMNLKTPEAVKRVLILKKNLKNLPNNVEVIICPSFTSLSQVATLAKKSKIALGAQDTFWEEKGTYTGEISPVQLKEWGVNYVIIGHSERRKYLKETDEMVNLKVKAALKNDLKPIICVGETLEERKRGQTEAIVIKQLKGALKNIKPSKSILITYEPVWAIWPGTPAKPQDTKRVAELIYQNLRKMYPKNIASKFQVIYGGSVDETNVSQFVDGKLITGVLVGNASLVVKKFLAIIKRVSK